MKRIYFFAFVLVAGLSAQGITLDECYRLARENYPLVRRYQLVEQTSRYSFSNAAKAYLPQVTFEGQATYQSDVTAFPTQMTALYQQLGIDFKGLSNDQYKLMLQLSQTIWDGGATKAQQETVKADEKVSQLTLDKELDALRSRINQIYFGILILEANQQINQYVDTLLADNMRLVESGVRNGVVLQSDLNNMKVERLTLQQQCSQLESTRIAYRQMLSLMIGKQLLPDEPIERPQLVSVDAVNHRTELQLFDAQLLQADARTRMLKASLYPHLGLFAQGWYGKPGLNVFEDMLNNQFSWNYIAGVRLQWNLSSWYTRANNLNKIALSKQSIEVQRDVFEWNVNLQQVQMNNEVAKMRGLQQSDEEIVHLRETIRQASQAKYQGGTVTVDVLLSDITNEKRAIQTQTLHELELLKNIYDLKVTLNQ